MSREPTLSSWTFGGGDGGSRCGLEGRRNGRQWHNQVFEPPRMGDSTGKIKANYEAADGGQAQVMAVVGEARDGILEVDDDIFWQAI